MNNLWERRRFLRELKRLAKENAEQDKPLCIMDNIVFKAMLASDTEESHEALRHLLSAPPRTRTPKVVLLLVYAVVFSVRGNKSSFFD